MQERAFADPKIEYSLNSAIDSIQGESSLTGVTIVDTVTGRTWAVEATGLFVAIGHDPRSGLVAAQVGLDGEGYVQVDSPGTRTTVEGVFACGDLVDRNYRQAITAAGTGCAAALDAECFLASLEHSRKSAVAVGPAR